MGAGLRFTRRGGRGNRFVRPDAVFALPSTAIGTSAPSDQHFDSLKEPGDRMTLAGPGADGALLFAELGIEHEPVSKVGFGSRSRLGSANAAPRRVKETARWKSQSSEARHRIVMGPFYRRSRASSIPASSGKAVRRKSPRGKVTAERMPAGFTWGSDTAPRMLPELATTKDGAAPGAKPNLSGSQPELPPSPLSSRKTSGQEEPLLALRKERLLGFMGGFPECPRNSGNKRGDSPLG